MNKIINIFIKINFKQIIVITYLKIVKELFKKYAKSK